MNLRSFVRGACLAVIALPLPAAALDLPGYLAQVTDRHHGLAALRLSRESAEDKRIAGDLELTPQLSLGGSYLSDKKQPNMLGANETRATVYQLGLGKKFETGTGVNLTAQTGSYEQLGLADNPVFAQLAKYGQGNLGISVSQSLWRNAFGRATRLRQLRESETAAAERGGYDLQSRQILTDAESSFWDYIYAKQEVELRKASLERADRIDKWISRRAADGIADRADVLNGKSLAASRRLQLLNSEDDLVAVEKKLRDFLELAPNEPTPELQGPIATVRDPRRLVGGDADAPIVSYDAWLSSQQAKATASGSREAEDQMRSDLSVSGSYATNSYAPGGTYADASHDLTRTNTPTAQFGVTWTYMFETDAKRAALSRAHKDALAASNQADRKAREGETAWSELNRRHDELTKKIDSISQVAKLQRERAKALQIKLSNGRAITTDVINSEQDAAESELNWAKLQAEQRKLEAQSRYFITLPSTQASASSAATEKTKE